MLDLPGKNGSYRYPTNISGRKLTGVASFMLPSGLDYVKSNVNVMLMVAELNH